MKQQADALHLLGNVMVKDAVSGCEAGSSQLEPSQETISAQTILWSQWNVKPTLGNLCSWSTVMSEVAPPENLRVYS